MQGVQLGADDSLNGVGVVWVYIENAATLEQVLVVPPEQIAALLEFVWTVVFLTEFQAALDGLVVKILGFGWMF